MVKIIKLAVCDVSKESKESNLRTEEFEAFEFLEESQAEEVAKFCGGRVLRYTKADNEENANDVVLIEIPHPQGPIILGLGDCILKGKKGDFYTYKTDEINKMLYINIED